MICKWEQNATIDHSPGKAHNPVKKPCRKVTQLAKAALLCSGVSCWKLGCQFGIARTHVRKILKKEDIIHRKCEKGPKYHGDQLQQAKIRCGILSSHFSSNQEQQCHGEFYLSLQNDCCPGNDGFYVQENTPFDDVPIHIRIQPHDKYPVKVMVWLAISECGTSAPCFCPWKLLVDTDRYRYEYIKKRLVPSLDSHHADGDYYFWPDLARSHYAKGTVQLFNEEPIAYIPEAANPPNLVVLNFGQLKIWGDGWSQQFMKVDGRQNQSVLWSKDAGRSWKSSSQNTVRLLRNVKSNLRNAADYGIMSANR